MSHKSWTADEIALLRAWYPDTRAADIAGRLGRTREQVLDKASDLGLRKTPETIARMAREAIEQPDHPARRSRFQNGCVPWNLGTHYQPGGGSVATRFQPGQRRGKAAEIYQPVGAERITKDGYLQRKINDDQPIYKRWKDVHRIVWEEAHGPVPAGHAICFKDGNPRNLALDNLELIHRGDLMRRNSCHNHGPQVARLVQLQGAITRQIHQRQGKGKAK